MAKPGGRDDFEDEAPRGPRRRGRVETTPGLDWGAADEPSLDAPAPAAPTRKPSRDADESAEAPRRQPARTRVSLLELCTPVFACSALLPRDGGSTAQPAYASFRRQVLEALQRIETEAPEQGVDPEDAAEAAYALCLYLDEQVLDSEWNGKEQWLGEMLHITQQKDPEGGVNFFRRLEELSPRQVAAKEVYFACLAMGFRGRYAELDPASAAAQLADLRQKTLRGVLPAPLDKEPLLFPQGYHEAEPIVQEGPPVPRWWIGVAAGLVALVLVIYIVLVVAAGRLPQDAERTVAPLARSAPSGTSGGGERR